MTGFLNGQYSATVMSQDIAFTAEYKREVINGFCSDVYADGSLVLMLMRCVLTWYLGHSEGVSALLFPEEEPDGKTDSEVC